MPFKDPEKNREYQRNWPKQVDKYPLRLYNNMRKRAKAQALEVNFTYDQFNSWVMSQPEYKKLHAEWKQLGFNTDLSPAVVRIQASLGYQLDNFYLTVQKDTGYLGSQNETSQNNLVQHRARLAKKVLCNETGTVYNSQSEAEQDLNLGKDKIRRYFKGDYKSLKGYTFTKVSLKGYTFTKV